MASLQARHSRGCALGRPGRRSPTATKRKAARVPRCTTSCSATTASSSASPSATTGKEAERALDAVPRRRRSPHAIGSIDDIRFDAWADRWLAGFTGKPNTRRVYETRSDYAKRAFGNAQGARPRRRRRAPVPRPDPRGERSSGAARNSQAERRAAGATCRRRRSRSTCASSAPACRPPSPRATRPRTRSARCTRARGRRSRSQGPPTTPTPSSPASGRSSRIGRCMLALCKAAVATGLRFGELAALRWSDVDLLNRELHVAPHLHDGLGEQTPKSNEPRTHRPDPAGRRRSSKPGTPSRRRRGAGIRARGGRPPHLAATSPRSVLYPALERAGIPRIGERGRSATSIRSGTPSPGLALEDGAEITWVQRQLGHSSITLTVDTYGHWSRAAEKSQADRLAGAFPV